MSGLLTFTWGRSSPLPVFSREGGWEEKEKKLISVNCLWWAGAALLTDWTVLLSSPTEGSLMNHVLTGLCVSREQIRWAHCSEIPVALSPRMALL